MQLVLQRSFLSPLLSKAGPGKFAPGGRDHVISISSEIEVPSLRPPYPG